LDLLADDIVHGVFQRALVAGFVDVLAPFLGGQKLQQLRRPDQTPGVGRKDSVHVHSSPRSAATTGTSWVRETCEGHALLGPVRCAGLRSGRSSARMRKAGGAAVRSATSGLR